MNAIDRFLGRPSKAWRRIMRIRRLLRHADGAVARGGRGEDISAWSHEELINRHDQARK